MNKLQQKEKIETRNTQNVNKHDNSMVWIFCRSRVVLMKKKTNSAKAKNVT